MEKQKQHDSDYTAHHAHTVDDAAADLYILQGVICAKLT